MQNTVTILRNLLNFVKIVQHIIIRMQFEKYEIIAFYIIR